ncbi:MAG: hypothetical protein A3J50_02120 [Candidatus Woykebacteria bacterium RIFCSPHIGHO2_02_FULL_43_16b]|uniref:Polysaccharide chain length determinant N-terminal domain-containing protein n=1 Tax=Candidatus Woykebacteria bacterium RIFCSPHIGHO2_02_FULL_43_16b TaxID=1802601 RepID=A0A1G1WKS3_9BACT|nr:MAG: hypothetical protein A3J50_02120 [Candidatus Woykebacteria bacterium RIFCSPHIGHO2_02_FULL_43_16b]
MAELNEITKILGRHLKFILVMVVLGGFVGFTYSYVGGQKYESFTTIYVKRTADQNSTSYYSYDGYYAQQVGKEYTDTVLGLLKTIDPYNEAAKRLGTYSPRALFSQSKAKKISSQVIELRIRSQSETEAKALMSALVAGLTTKVGELNRTGDSKISIEPVTNEPFTELNKTQALLNAGIGFLSGLVVSLVSLAIFVYSKPSK